MADYPRLFIIDWSCQRLASAATTWGDSLNGDLADIDTQMFAAQAGGLADRRDR